MQESYEKNEKKPKKTDDITQRWSVAAPTVKRSKISASNGKSLSDFSSPVLMLTYGGICCFFFIPLAWTVQNAPKQWSVGEKLSLANFHGEDINQ